MKREISLTRDGSHSISIPEMNVSFHSIHGAIQESQHVFIRSGLLDSGIFDYTGVHSVLEIGFGTGLNALLTLIEADRHQNRIYYTAVEPYPIEMEMAAQLNYCEQLNLPGYEPRFLRMHEITAEEMFEISNQFRLTKYQCTIQELVTTDQFNIIYFDAFAPAAMPELWTREIFEQMYRLLAPGGILVTYCSKSIVRKAMQAAGLTVEKIQGPWGKREMLRAVKVEKLRG